MVLPADGSDLTNRSLEPAAPQVGYATQEEAEEAITGPSVVAYFEPRTSLSRSDLLMEGGIESDPVDLIQTRYKDVFPDGSGVKLAWPRILQVVSAWEAHGISVQCYWEAMLLHQMDKQYLDQLQLFVSLPAQRHSGWSGKTSTDGRCWSVVRIDLPDGSTHREREHTCGVQ